jgi:SAM-dependent methyltransferase
VQLVAGREVLSDSQRQKQDCSNDELFYAEPRFVQHLDAAFRERLTQLYRERIASGAVVLDLMSSWVSHLPNEITYQKVIGHGLNEQELAANPRLDSHWQQNLNLNQELPLPDQSVDVCLIVAGWQYLQYPENIAAEILRIIRPGGQLIISFSNRMFFTKAPQVWAAGSDREHLVYVASVLMAQGWPKPEIVAESTRAKGWQGMIGAAGDPFFALIASKPAIASNQAANS